MKTTFLSIFFLVGSFLISFSQNVGINADGTAPDSKAMLDVKSNNKGVLIPRLTITERDAITDPPTGLMVFCTDCGVNGALAIYSGTQWRSYQDCVTASPTAGAQVPFVSSIQWVWANSSPVILKYKWNTSNDWAIAIDMGDSLNYTETGLNCNTSYTRYVWALSGCGVSAPVELTATTFMNPGTPDTLQGTPTANQIVWKWKAYHEATGYKWNSTNDYATATDIGSELTYTQTGLTGATKYNAYVWVTTDCGYSQTPAILTEITPAAPCDPATVDYGGITYHILQIGTKCWMKENMNIGTKVLGNTDQTNNSVIEKYCYNDDEANCTAYGGLYQWNEAMQYVVTDGAKGICPTGWHVARKTEWDALTTLANSMRTNQQGIVLKESGIDHWQTAGGENDIGFTVLGTGNRYYGEFFSLKQYSSFWTSTTVQTTGVWYTQFSYNSNGCNTSYTATKTTGNPVRCVKD